MRAVVDAAQALAVDMAVQLRRRQGAVAEQVLDRSQVGAALEQVRREGMAQPVWVREHAAERRGVQPPATRRQEERVLGAPARARAVPGAGTAPRGAPPLRRAGRCAPSRPCRGRGAARGRSRRRRDRDRPPRSFAGRPSRRARRARGCAAPADRRRRARRAPPRPLPSSACPASRLGRRGASDASGTCAAPSVKRRKLRTAATFRAIVAGASLRGRARPSSAA